MKSQFSLLRTQKFLPLFIVQFLGAFNDNFAKSMYVVFVAYGLWGSGAQKPEVLVSIAAAVFILPFVLITPYAGGLADRYDKAKMIVWAKLAELVIVCVAVGALFLSSVPLAFFSLFLLGVQSAFFSPCKFSILPQHLERTELIAGNALVSSGTYIAILIGTMTGAFIAPLEYGVEIGSLILFLAAILGIVLAYKIPPAVASDIPVRERTWNFIKPIGGVVISAWRQGQGIFAAIVGTGWFYFIAATFHAQFPNFTKQALSADSNVLALFMAVFSIGVAAGGLINHTLLKGLVSARLVPWAAMGVGLCGLDLYFASFDFPAAEEGGLWGVRAFFAVGAGWRITLDIFMLAAFAGLYVIPLRAIVQERADVPLRGRVISASNMIEALFILASAVLAAFLFSLGTRIDELFLLVSGVTFIIGCGLFISFHGRARPIRKED